MTNLYVRHQQVRRDELAKTVSAATAKVGSGWYFINFTLERADILKAPEPNDILDWEIATTGGRIFGPNSEVKWQLSGKDCFDLWTLQESDPGGRCEGWTPFENLTTPDEPVKFYCMGAWDGGFFREGRLPNSFGYPLSGNMKEDRVFFEAVEYSPSPPRRSAGQQLASKHVPEIMNALNRPRVLAYRLTGMGFDHGEEPPHFVDEGDSDGS